MEPVATPELRLVQLEHECRSAPPRNKSLEMGARIDFDERSACCWQTPEEAITKESHVKVQQLALTARVRRETCWAMDKNRKKTQRKEMMHEQASGQSSAAVRLPKYKRTHGGTALLATLANPVRLHG